MEDKLKNIDIKYQVQLMQAHKDVDTATIALNNLIAIKNEEIVMVKAYFDALAQKAQAEIIIANTPIDIKT